MTSRWSRLVIFGLAALWTGLGAWTIADGDYVYGGFRVAIGFAWMLLALYRDRYNAWFDATRDRQRARLTGFNAITFPEDRPSRSQEE